MSDTYKRSTSGKSREAIARRKRQLARARRRARAPRKPFRFTRPVYDDAYFEAMQLLETLNS